MENVYPYNFEIAASLVLLVLGYVSSNTLEFHTC